MLCPTRSDLQFYFLLIYFVGKRWVDSHKIIGYLLNLAFEIHQSDDVNDVNIFRFSFLFYAMLLPNFLQSAIIIIRFGFILTFAQLCDIWTPFTFIIMVDWRHKRMQCMCESEESRKLPQWNYLNETQWFDSLTNTIEFECLLPLPVAIKPTKGNKTIKYRIESHWTRPRISFFLHFDSIHIHFI